MKYSIESQILISFASGLFLGMFSWGLFITAIFILMFEIFIFFIFMKSIGTDFINTRIGLNVAFFLGWTLSRTLYLRETGFEEISNTCEDFWCH